MNGDAHAPAPTYVDSVWSPAGSIGINIIKILLDFGATPLVLKIAPMGYHRRDFFWLRGDAPEASS